MSGVTFSLTEVVAIAGGIGTVLVVAYRLGSLARQVNTNERDIATIYRKLDDIWHYVRNGSVPKA